jgi:hypothetical protein
VVALRLPPERVNDDDASPENPASPPVLLNVKVPDVVNVPVPLSVPVDTVIDPPLFADGLAPNGSVQPLGTVMVPPVCANEKVSPLPALKSTELHASVTVCADPLNCTTPPPFVHVPPVSENPDAALMVPLDAVKVPEVSENVPETVSA